MPAFFAPVPRPIRTSPPIALKSGVYASKPPRKLLPVGSGSDKIFSFFHLFLDIFKY